MLVALFSIAHKKINARTFFRVQVHLRIDPSVVRLSVFKFIVSRSVMELFVVVKSLILTIFATKLSHINHKLSPRIQFSKFCILGAVIY